MLWGDRPHSEKVPTSRRSENLEVAEGVALRAEADTEASAGAARPEAPSVLQSFEGEAEDRLYRGGSSRPPQ